MRAFTDIKQLLKISSVECRAVQDSTVQCYHPGIAWLWCVVGQPAVALLVTAMYCTVLHILHTAQWTETLHCVVLKTTALYLDLPCSQHCTVHSTPQYSTLYGLQHWTCEVLSWFCTYATLRCHWGECVRKDNMASKGGKILHRFHTFMYEFKLAAIHLWLGSRHLDSSCSCFSPRNRNYKGWQLDRNKTRKRSSSLLKQSFLYRFSPGEITRSVWTSQDLCKIGSHKKNVQLWLWHYTVSHVCCS